MTQIRRLGPRDVPPALGLLQEAYARQRELCPDLPETIMCDPSLAAAAIEGAVARGAVGAMVSGALVGFMGVSAEFRFKGQRAVLMNELSHAAASRDAHALYGALYEALGSSAPLTTSRLHIVAHLAGEEAVAARLHSLGFGQFLAEEIRGLGEVPAGRAAYRVERLTDMERLVDLETEHRRYYRQSPIYLHKDDSPDSVRADLEEWAGPDTAVFIHAEDDAPLGYFAVSSCKGLEEGRLLRNTNSAQVLSAYVTDVARGKGAGRALLGRCVTWARERGFQRIMVEHETANLLGSAFWARHFRPYLSFVMRYAEVDAPAEEDRA